jgi:cell division protein FtsI (penicillin-binding protein 3)
MNTHNNPNAKKSGIKERILIRVQISFFMMILLAVAILFRMWTLQFVEEDRWIKRATKLRNVTIEATRGSIYAEDGSVLATSLPFFQVAIDPTIVSDSLFEQGVDSLGVLLADFYKEKTAQEYIAILRDSRKKDRQYVKLSKKELDYQEKKRFSTFPIFREGWKKGGVIYEKTNRRFRPFKKLARHTVGFVKQDTSQYLEGRGLEYSFNTDLAGVDGKVLKQRIAGGYWKPLNDGSQVRPKDGIDIHSTIDIHLQDTAHQILQTALQDLQADYGSILLMEVKTGEIKVIVNLGKNLNGRYVENNNYAVGGQGLAEPGSTFKLMSMVALFEEAERENLRISIKDTVDTFNGKHKYSDDLIMRDLGAYGKLSIQQVFEKSSNVGVSKLIWKYFKANPQHFINYLDEFGLTQPVEFQMAGAAQPYIKSPADPSWSASSLPWMSIGYELTISPLHTLTFYNAIANKGRMVQPIIVTEESYANKTLKTFRPKVLNNKICSDKTLKIVQDMLAGVVQDGTAKSIKSKVYKIAGKTGTTEKVQNKEYTDKNYTSFAGYFPADNPQYTCVVVIDNPKDKNKRYGGQTAAPVFKKLADVVYQRKIHNPLTKDENFSTKLPLIRGGNRYDIERVCKELGIAYEQESTSEWIKTRVHNDSLSWVETRIANQIIPDVRGMSLRDAMYLLENVGLKVSFEGNGRVKTQSIPQGSKAKKGRRIFLKLK